MCYTKITRGTEENRRMFVSAKFFLSRFKLFLFEGKKRKRKKKKLAAAARGKRYR